MRGKHLVQEGRLLEGFTDQPLVAIGADVKGRIRAILTTGGGGPLTVANLLTSAAPHRP